MNRANKALLVFVICGFAPALALFLLYTASPERPRHVDAVASEDAAPRQTRREARRHETAQDMDIRQQQTSSGGSAEVAAEVANEPSKPQADSQRPDDQQPDRGKEGVHNESDASQPAPVRWPLPDLNWNPDASLGEEGAKPEADNPLPPAYELPENTLELDVVVRDAVTSKPLLPAFVEVVDREGTLRVAAWITTSINSPRFQLSYGSDTTFLVRATAGNRVGYSVFGTGPGSNVTLHGVTVRTEFERGRQFYIHVNVWVSSQRERQAAEAVRLRVTDDTGVPLKGAVVYHYGGVLGQAAADGTMSFVVPQWSNEPVEGWYKERRFIAVHHPGRVPVFLEAGGLPAGQTTHVVLHAEEYVVTFYLLLSPELLPEGAVVGDPYSGPHTSSTRLQEDRGIYPPGLDPTNDKRWHRWRADSLGYAKARENYRDLQTAVRRSIDDDQVLKQYNFWYARQWRYDERTGNWQVVIPHPGRFIIALAEDIVTNEAGVKVLVMSPGLYIDATDPANPRIELIYPE